MTHELDQVPALDDFWLGLPENFVWKNATDSRLLVYECHPDNRLIGAVQEVHCTLIESEPCAYYAIKIYRMVLDGNLVRGWPYEWGTGAVVKIVMETNGRETAILDRCSIHQNDTYRADGYIILNSAEAKGLLFLL